MPRPSPAIRPPILAKVLETTAIEELDGVELDQARIEACELSQRTGERIRFDGVHIEGGTLSETKLDLVGWVDVLCERCDLSMIDWPKAKLTRVEFRDCRWTGAKGLEIECDNVRFFDCKLEYASFPAGRFRNVAFERCSLKEADFTAADLSGTAFVQCDLDGIDLTRAQLRAADVSGSTFRSIRLEANDVRGLVVNREQATALAKLFGLVIRDDG